MVLRVSGKNFNIGEAMRTHVVERVDAATSKYFGGGVTGHVIIDHEGSGYRADCTLHLTSGVTLHSEGRAQEPYASFDQAADRLERRLRRYKQRLKEHHGSGAAATIPAAAETVASYVLEAPDDEHGDEKEYSPVVIAERNTKLVEMSVSGAVTELDFTGAPVQIFRHATSGRVNIVYRRPDGNIGWIDPAGLDEKSAKSRA